MKRNHQEELMARILFRAIRETKNLDTANLIVMGDTIGADNTGDKVGELFKIYNLKMSECMRIAAFIDGKSSEL